MPETQPSTESGDAEAYVLPASFAQQRLWFLDRLEPDRAVYNVPVAWRLRGRLDVEALSGSLASLVARHEALRTTFSLIDGVPHQVVAPAADLLLERIDGADERAALALLNELAKAPFDLAAGPLLRATLIRLADADHLLVLVAHHIVVDAWSLGLIGRELSAFYGAAVDGRDAGLPELEIQYGDYAAWQQQWIESGGLDRQLDHWKQALAGAPAVLELPSDRPRPARQSYRGATTRVMLPSELLDGLRALAAREGATMFMTLLAAFSALLSRYSGQDDLVIASPVANRNRVELEGVVGLFVNTLALRVELGGEPSFRQLLARVRETALGAFSNQDLPFEKLVEELNPQRHLSHAPVAQVMFVLQSGVERPRPLPGLEQELVASERGTAKFDLSLFTTETPEGLRVSLEYCTDLFDEATAARLIEHYRALLEAAVATPDRPVAELELMSAAEREQVLVEWNDTARGPLPGRCVHELVAEQARRSPAALAVELGEDRLTYAELDERAERWARRLRALGVGPDVVVAICADRSIEAVVAVLAVLKAGGAYAPIDPAYPEDRVAFMLADTDTPVLLTQRHLLERLPEHRAEVLCLDDDPGEAPAAAAADAATVANLAYVLFTSGSTGRPKGVAMGHGPLANLIDWQLADLPAPAAARTLQFASLSFDVAFQEMFSTWCSGGTLVLLDEATRRDPQALLAHLAHHRVERLFLPFVALQNLCEAAAYLGAEVPSLRQVITAGEQLKSTDAIRAFFAAHPGCSLANHYGPTESHVVTAFTLPQAPERWPALPPIGRPITGARIYLLDAHRRPVPAGVPGELYIGGAALARGYLGRPDLTEERFVADPFAGEPGARLYRTGDLARHLRDGTIEYLGRADHQLKIRGFRIEPGEVEAALRSHPAVREALVVGREGTDGERRLVAYLIADGDAPAPGELRELLRRTLPDYMVPAAFVPLAAFPLSPNGKVDRAALDRMTVAVEDGEKQSVAPRTDTERRVAAIWCDVLGVQELGVTDDFFELGGHSLMAVRLFAELERKLGVRLPLSALFETATVAGLAGMVDRERVSASDWPTVVELRRGGGHPPLFLIAWAGGEVLPYRDLVESLSADIPVFGLMAPGADRRAEPLASVDALAAHYVGLVREVQPAGPYCLGGFCFSGLVAYEMARLLIAQGESVSLVAMIDAYPYRRAKRPTRVEIERVKLEVFRKADVRGKFAWIRGRLIGLKNRGRSAVYLRIGPRLYERLAARGLQGHLPRRPWNLVLIVSNLARRDYVPAALDVRVDFFRAQKAADGRPTPWDELAGGGVVLHEIVAPDIDHASMMRLPYARLLADALSHVIEESAENASTGAPRRAVGAGA